MTVEEAQGEYPTFRVPKSQEGSACSYATLNGWPAGIGVMVDAGKVARVEVRRGNFATSTGARIGDTEQRIQSLYPGQVTVSPHKYTDGHYLTVDPTAEADSAYRIIFETTVGNGALPRPSQTAGEYVEVLGRDRNQDRVRGYLEVQAGGVEPRLWRHAAIGRCGRRRGLRNDSAFRRPACGGSSGWDVLPGFPGISLP